MSFFRTKIIKEYFGIGVLLLWNAVFFIVCCFSNKRVYFVNFNVVRGFILTSFLCFLHVYHKQSNIKPFLVVFSLIIKRFCTKSRLNLNGTKLAVLTKQIISISKIYILKGNKFNQLNYRSENYKIIFHVHETEMTAHDCVLKSVPSITIVL